MNTQEILLQIVGIHLFLGISLILISIVLFIFVTKSKVYLVITSLLLLTFAHFYYYLYYTGYLVNFPNLIFAYPILNVAGHVFLFHTFLKILMFRNFWNRRTLLHLPVLLIQMIQVAPLLLLDEQDKILSYRNQREHSTPEGIAGWKAEYYFYGIAIFYISFTMFLFIKKFFPNLLSQGNQKSKNIKMIDPEYDRNDSNNEIKLESKRDSKIHKFTWIPFSSYIVLILSFLSWMLVPNIIFHVIIPLAFSIFVPVFLIGLIFFPYILQLGVQISVPSDFTLPKYAKSNLQNLDLVALENKIHQLMEDKIYLQEDLNLPKLASLCKISIHQLSAYFNLIKGVKYPDFIRKYRIEEAKILLIERKEWNTTRIGYESGFNSTSSFFEAFKNEVGISPSEFRKNFKNSISTS